MSDMAAGSAVPLDQAGGRHTVGEKPAMRLRFAGDGATYFGIWIVNILLSIVTLGIYSAWAKVRTRRYFYGNTSLDGDAFDYHANPIAILKGRVIAAAVIILLAVASEFSLILYLAALLAVTIAFPWIYNRSLRFNARMTSWRNVRFDFHGTYGSAFVAVIVMPVVSVLSLGTLLPFATRVHQNYVLHGLRYGTAPFRADIRIGALYRGLLFAALTFVAGLVILGLLAFLAYMALEDVLLHYANVLAQAGQDPGAFLASFVIVGIYLAAGVLLIAWIVYRTVARNVAFNSTTLDGAGRLWSRLSPGRVVWITGSNTLAIVATLGIFYPWAKTRIWRYRAELTGIVAEGDLGAFVDSTQPAGDAFGSEYAELSDIDVGL